jgi:hypothetical protein
LKEEPESGELRSLEKGAGPGRRERIMKERERNARKSKYINHITMIITVLITNNAKMTSVPGFGRLVGGLWLT